MNPLSSALKQIARRTLPRSNVLRLKRLVSTLHGLRPYRFTFPTIRPEPLNQAASHTPTRENPLEELGAIYQPTKRLHNYLSYYWTHLRDKRETIRSVIEIGVQTDRSIRMWEAFFPNATIYGIDIDPRCKAFEGGRRKMFIGDQSDEAFLRSVIAQTGTPDLIIDDGSHLVEHQLTTFNILFPLLSSHGIYVIEDVGGCVGDYSLRTVNALKAIIDQIQYWPPQVDPEDWLSVTDFPDHAPWAARHTIGIAFYPAIIFVLRGKNPQDNLFLTQTNR